VIKAESVTNIGNNHQVLAYGYEIDGDLFRLWVYDNNFPLEEVTLTSYPDDPHITSTEGLGARGWFLQGYTPKVPPYLVGGTLLRETSAADLHVVHGGAAFALTSGERTALGLDVTPVTEIADGSLAWVATAPADGTVVRDRTSSAPAVVYGGAPFALPADTTRPGEIVLAGQTMTVIDVPDGAVANLPTVPRDHTLLREEHDTTIYRMEDGQRRPVASSSVIDQNGWRAQNVRIVPDRALSGLTVGPPITGPS